MIIYLHEYSVFKPIVAAKCDKDSSTNSHWIEKIHYSIFPHLQQITQLFENAIDKRLSQTIHLGQCNIF